VIKTLVFEKNDKFVPKLGGQKKPNFDSSFHLVGLPGFEDGD
jgi:hypothetical protein